MGRLSTEERHKRQLESFSYVPVPSKQQQLVEAYTKRGYKVSLSNGIPIFSCKSIEEARSLRNELSMDFSIGFTYPASEEAFEMEM